jgi:hypothetical protein
MSSTLQTPKISTIRLLNDRNLMSQFILAALAVTFMVIFTYAVDRSAANSINDQAYMIHRQGEWVSVPISIDSAEAYRIYRQGEVTSPVSNAEAYLIHRQGEWASVALPVVALTAYHLSERTLVDPNAGLAIYLQSEHNLVDPQAGLAIYQQSERTRVPVRFTKYQLSEWFGEKAIVRFEPLKPRY